MKTKCQKSPGKYFFCPKIFDIMVNLWYNVEKEGGKYARRNIRLDFVYCFRGNSS